MNSQSEEKGQVKLFQVVKLSNRGWSTNMRMLRIDKHSLSYLSKTIPKNQLSNQNQASISVTVAKAKPKKSIPLKFIRSVAPLCNDSNKKDNDCQQVKKFSVQKLDQSFKVQFEANKLVQGLYSQQDSETVQEEKKSQKKNQSAQRQQSTRSTKNSTQMMTWYFMAPSGSGCTSQQWIEMINERKVVAIKRDTDLNLAQQKSDQINQVPAQNNSNLNDEQRQHRDSLVDLQAAATSNIKASNLNKQDKDGRKLDGIQVKELDDDPQLNSFEEDMRIQSFDIQNSRAVGEKPSFSHVRRLSKSATNLGLKGNNERNPNNKENLDKLQQKSLQEKEGEVNWDLKFQNLWSMIINSQITENAFEANMALSEKLFNLVGKFNRESAQIVTEIVHDYFCKPHQRKFKPLQQLESRYKVFMNQQDSLENVSDQGFGSYIIRGIFVKICRFGEKAQSSGIVGSIGSETFEPAMMHKAFGREFNANDMIMNGLLFTSNVETKYKLRAPLACQIDYRGFRAICYPKLPIRPEKGLSLGFDEDGRFHSLDVNLHSEVQDVASLLNLAEMKTSMKTKNQSVSPNGRGSDLNFEPTRRAQEFQSVPLSNSVKIYSQAEHIMRDMRKVSQRKLERNVHKLKETSYLEPVQYILNTLSLFPLDFHACKPFNKNEPLKGIEDFDWLPVHPDRVIREQLFSSMNSQPIKVDLRKNIQGQLTRQHYLNRMLQQSAGMTDEQLINVSKRVLPCSTEELNDYKILEALSIQIQDNLLKNVSDCLENMQEIPICSKQITEVLHSRGINIRYLGSLTRLVVQSHIRNLCITQMIAHVAKNIYNEQIAESILGGITDRNGQMINSEEQRNQLIQHWTIDFMNLLLGNSEEKTLFWEQVLLKRVSVYFQYQYSELCQAEIRPTSLYFAFLDLTNLSEIVNLQNLLGCQDRSPSARGSVRNNRYSPIQGGQATTSVVGGITSLASSRVNSPSGCTTQQQQQISFDAMSEDARKNYLKDQLVYKNFFVTEKPFGDPENPHIKFRQTARIKSVSLKGLPYRVISQNVVDYLEEGQVELAVKACHMQRIYSQEVLGVDDTSAILDLCEIALGHTSLRNMSFGSDETSKKSQKSLLRTNQWTSAIKKTFIGLQALTQHKSALHAETIQFYAILLQAFYMLGQKERAEAYFNKAVAVLEYNCGPAHPLQITLYNIYANLLIKNKELVDADCLLQSSLRCCLEVLGQSHIKTAQVHSDLGKLQVRMGFFGKALNHFKQSFQVYKYFYGMDDLQTAKSAFQAASILDEIGHYSDAYEYARIAATTFSKRYGVSSDATISARWQQVSLAYILKEKDCLRQATRLFTQLKEKELKIRNQKPEDDTYDAYVKTSVKSALNPNEIDLLEACSEASTLIGVMLVALIIMERLRTLDTPVKQHLRTYCWTLIENQSEPISLNARERFEHIDVNRVSNVTYLKFTRQKAEQLAQWGSIAYLNDENIDQYQFVPCFVSAFESLISDVVKMQTEQNQAGGTNVQKQKQQTFLRQGTLQTKRLQSIRTQATMRSTKNGQQIQATLEPYEEQFGDTRDEIMWKLITIFDHINFFNLLQPESYKQPNQEIVDLYRRLAEAKPNQVSYNRF